MFRPEKLLGGLLGGGSRRGGANLLTSQLGMGLIGVAIAAADHYMKKSSPQAAPAPGTYTGSVPPPAPGATAPPPPPGPSPATAPPPPPDTWPATSPPGRRAGGGLWRERSSPPYPGDDRGGQCRRRHRPGGTAAHPG